MKEIIPSKKVQKIMIKGLSELTGCKHMTIKNTSFKWLIIDMTNDSKN